jgi:hypothetical protein
MFEWDSDDDEEFFIVKKRNNDPINISISGINLDKVDKMLLDELGGKKTKKLSSTSIVTLGNVNQNISCESTKTILYGDSYKINLYMNDTQSLSSFKKCTWCHQDVAPGTLLLGVPYEFVPSVVKENMYSPECLNTRDKLLVEKQEPIKKTDKTKKQYADKSSYLIKSVPFSVNATEQRDYFKISHPVCSFNCMESKGRELAMRDPKYNNFRTCVGLLYRLLFDQDPPDRFIPALHFETLNIYGGPFTLEEYRNNFMYIGIENTKQYYNLIREKIYSVMTH